MSTIALTEAFQSQFVQRTNGHRYRFRFAHHLTFNKMFQPFEFGALLTQIFSCEFAKGNTIVGQRFQQHSHWEKKIYSHSVHHCLNREVGEICTLSLLLIITLEEELAVRFCERNTQYFLINNLYNILSQLSLEKKKLSGWCSDTF